VRKSRRGELDWLKHHIFIGKIQGKISTEQWTKHLNNEGKECKIRHVKESIQEGGGQYMKKVKRVNMVDIIQVWNGILKHVEITTRREMR
jgi:hypothetical protein